MFLIQNYFQLKLLNVHFLTCPTQQYFHPNVLLKTGTKNFFFNLYVSWDYCALRPYGKNSFFACNFAVFEKNARKDESRYQPNKDFSLPETFVSKNWEVSDWISRKYLYIDHHDENFDGLFK